MSGVCDKPSSSAELRDYGSFPLRRRREKSFEVPDVTDVNPGPQTASANKLAGLRPVSRPAFRTFAIAIRTYAL